MADVNTATVIKVNVTTVAGNCHSFTSFDGSSTVKDLALAIRTQLGVPLSLQHLVLGSDILTDLSQRLSEVVGDASEIDLSLVKRSYKMEERAALFKRLVRATVAGHNFEIRELLKEGAPVKFSWEDAHTDESVVLSHWQDDDEIAQEKEKAETKETFQAMEEELEVVVEGDGESEEISDDEEDSSSDDSRPSVDKQNEASQTEARAAPCGGLTPLMLAKAFGNDALVNDYKACGADDVDMVSSFSTLNMAFASRDLVNVVKLIAARADVDTRLSRGEGVQATGEGSPLHACAAMHRLPGAYEVAQLLIQKKANLQAGDSEGDTPLAHARYFSATELFGLLEGAGAEVRGPFYERFGWR